MISFRKEQKMLQRFVTGRFEKDIFGFFFLIRFKVHRISKVDDALSSVFILPPRPAGPRWPTNVSNVSFLECFGNVAVVYALCRFALMEKTTCDNIAVAVKGKAARTTQSIVARGNPARTVLCFDF